MDPIWIHLRNIHLLQLFLVAIELANKLADAAIDSKKVIHKANGAYRPQRNFSAL